MHARITIENVLFCKLWVNMRARLKEGLVDGVSLAVVLFEDMLQIAHSWIRDLGGLFG